MSTTWIIFFDILLEFLFVCCGVMLLVGMVGFRRKHFTLIMSKSTRVVLQIVPALSLALQVPFLVLILMPEMHYPFVVASSLAMIYAYIVGSEGIFAEDGDYVWFGFKKYKKTAIAVSDVQRRKGTALNAVFAVAPGRKFVYRTTDANWEIVRKALGLTEGEGE